MRRRSARKITRAFSQYRFRLVVQRKIAQRRASITITRALKHFRFQRVLERKIALRTSELRKYQKSVEAAAGQIIYRALSYHCAHTTMIRRLQQTKQARERAVGRMMDPALTVERDLCVSKRESTSYGSTVSSISDMVQVELETNDADDASDIHDRNLSSLSATSSSPIEKERLRLEQLRSRGKQRFRSAVRRKTHYMLQRNQQRRRRQEPPLTTTSSKINR